MCNENKSFVLVSKFKPIESINYDKTNTINKTGLILEF